MGVYKRGNTYWIKYKVNGEYRYESSHSPLKDEAERLYFLRKGAVAANKTLPAPNLTVGDLLDAALRAQRMKRRRSMKDNERNAKYLCEDFGKLKVSELTTDMVRRVSEHDLAQGDKPSTINRRLSLLKYAYRLAYKESLISQPLYIELLPEDNTRRGFLEPADFQRFLSCLPDDGLRDLVEWLGWTGMRIGEARQLTFAMLQGDVELFVPGSIRKNGRDRVIPLTGPLKTIIDRRRALRATDLSKTFLFWRGKNDKVGQFRGAWVKGLKEAGLSQTITPHDLCRSAMRNLVRAGVPETVAMEIAGRKTRAIFDRYNITSRRDVAEGLEKLSSYIDQSKPKVVPLAS